MNIKEYLNSLKEKGFSDIAISNKTEDIGAKISRTQIYLLRTGRSNNPTPSTCKALADAFGYELKYEHGEPQFYPKEATAPAIRDDPEKQKADEIYAYLKANGINDIEELKRFFEDVGAVFGANEREIRDIVAKLRALDALRGLVKKNEVK